jgi:hypothetical protein
LFPVAPLALSGQDRAELERLARSEDRGGSELKQVFVPKFITATMD